MSISIRPLSPVLGTEVTGVDLGAPLDAATAGALKSAFELHPVLCIRGKPLSHERLLATAKLFGTPKKQINEHQHLAGFPEIGVLSSESKDVHGTGERVIQGTTWHTDHSFTARPPAATLLHAMEIPATGGDTSFCNMRAAYEALPEETKREIAGVRAVHRYESSRSPRKMMARTASEKARTPDVTHPLVRIHPPTGKPALYMSTTRLECVEGWPRARSDELVDELLAHATENRFQYHHNWRAGDVLIWDNRCLMHHANGDYPLDATRRMHRVLIEGEIPTGYDLSSQLRD